jgi:hypothetical protein
VFQPRHFFLPLQRRGGRRRDIRHKFERRFPPVSSPAVMVSVARDRKYPGLEQVSLAERFPMPEYAKENFLDQVLAQLRLPSHTPTESKQATVVALKQVRHQGHVAPAHTVHDLLVTPGICPAQVGPTARYYRGGVSLRKF